MSCGRISFLSRIKWLFGYSFSRTKRPYETGKCHDCLWCEYIKQCMEDYQCLVKPEIDGDFYELVKLELNSAYGKAVSAAYRKARTHAVYVEPNEKTESLDKSSIYPWKCQDWLCNVSEWCRETCSQDCKIYRTQKCSDCSSFEKCRE